MLIILAPITGGVRCGYSSTGSEKRKKKKERKSGLICMREREKERETDRVCVCERERLCVCVCVFVCMCMCVKAMINFRSQSCENMMYNQSRCYCWATDQLNVGFQLALFTSVTTGNHTLLTSNKPHQCNELDKGTHLGSIFDSLQYGYMM